MNTNKKYLQDCSTEDQQNPDFEHDAFSDRLKIDDPFREDLVTRDGRKAKINSISGNSAYGTINGFETSWFYYKRDGYHLSLKSFLEPHRWDVMLPKSQ